ncbi:hypothetical protein E0H26_03510 [Micromonospora zingiberis]|uniref:Uncharacterized protein n=1 Tax=Micromonospora zingiberis TaxID=2053011 RepID=A0A4R0GVN6_9ACTN|nr:hypothetical protein [Micromonospora zingiberis]TCB99638.1 hypothetical protein E0H26_03510 [Micromonospora zingiberis]
MTPPPAAPAQMGKRVAAARRQLIQLTEGVPLSNRLTLSDGVGLLQLALDRLTEAPDALLDTPAVATRVNVLFDQVELCWARTGGAGDSQRLALLATLNRDIRDAGRTVDDLLRLVDPDGDARSRRFRLLTEVQQQALGHVADQVDAQLGRLEESLRRHRSNDEHRGVLLAEQLRGLDQRVAELLYRERRAYQTEFSLLTRLREEARLLCADLRVRRTEFWTDDGTRSRERRQADRWRHVGLGFGALGLVVLVVGALAHRNNPQWPILIASIGITTTATYLMALCLRESAGHRAHERQIGADQHHLAKITLVLSEIGADKRPDLVEQLLRRLIDGDGRPGSDGAPLAMEQHNVVALLAQMLTALAGNRSGGAGTDPRT